jgi:hypothetical protein
MLKAAFWALAGSLALAPSLHANRLVGPKVLAAGADPRGIAAADLDGDGISEIIVANFGAPTLIGQTNTASAGNIQIFKNLALSQTLVGGNSPRSLAVADLNNDGLPDIIATYYGSNQVGVFLQKPDHSFAPAALYATLQQPVGVSAGRVNGTWMVAVANYGSATISLFSADSHGVLSPAGTAATGANPTDVAVFVPSASHAQLISANYGGNSLTLWELGPSGQTQDRRDLPLPGNPCRLAFADLNGDKLADMAVALFTTSQVAVYYQSGGTFSGSPVLVPLAGLHPNGLAVARVSGQAAPLIVTADRDSDQLDLVGRGADGALTVTASLSVKDGDNPQFGPVEVATGDFDGGGRLGFVSSQMRNGRLNVYSQQAPAAPQISSATHPDPTQFYASTNASFSWTAPQDFDGIDHYVYTLDQSPSTVPTSAAKVAVEPNLTVSGLDTGNYFLHVRAMDKAGNMGDPSTFRIGVTAQMSAANTYNWPNPSTTGHTNIRFALMAPSSVQIRIYDEFSALVWSRDLSPAETVAGVNSVEWDGHNDRGQQVGNGGYILQVSDGRQTVTKKIAIVR